MLALFAAIYLVNALVLSNTLGRFVLVPKSEFFGTSASSWKGREEWVDFSGKDSAEAELESVEGGKSVAADYLARFPVELASLARHAMPVVCLLALYGIVRRRVFLLAAFVPLIVYPVFTVRSEARYILPYVPPLIMYAAIGLDAVKNKMARLVVTGLVVLSTAAGLYVNRAELTTPVSNGFQWAKRVGLGFRDRVGAGEKIADRKPFLAFYAGAEYVEIPVGPYDETLRSLAAERARFLVLHRSTTHTLRPALRPLMYDREVIAGELRFNQVYFEPGVVLVYERTGRAEPLKSESLTAQASGTVVFPAWSPDGRMIAYRSSDSSGNGGIFVVSVGGGEPQRAISGPAIVDPISWAPDSRRIAFASASGGNTDIYIFDVFSGALEHVTTHDGSDTSPSWSSDGNEIAFCSDRGGMKEVWVKDLSSGALTQLTSDGGNTFPSIAPDGRRIAWLHESRGLTIEDRLTGERVAVSSPREVSFTPAWSPDGRVIAVTAQDWGGADVYLAAADGTGALLLTKSVAGDGMPSWAPDGRRMAIASNEDGAYSLRILNGVGVFADRVLNPVAIRTFPRPVD
jgi:hypothetical protein